MTGKPRLLIVDDDIAVAEFVGEIAEELGFDARLVHDGLAFDAAYTAHNPSGIVLDLKLPGRDGVALLRFLGDQHCEAAIFVASGTDPRTLAAARTVGSQHNLRIAGALSKPLTIESLTEALAPLLAAEASPQEPELRTALANGDIRAYFQPKVDLVDGAGFRMSGVESLARWRRPGGGFVMPDQFIPAVRDAGAMPNLTDRVVDDSLKAARLWMDQGIDITVSINLDGSMLDDLTVPDRLARKADKAGVPASRITLEITESAAMADPAATMDILTRLRVKEFNVSMDDFGTGYSSLVQLYRLPFNELKIDKSFVMDIGKNREADIIVEALAMLGRKLGLKVCAEGIESPAMLDHVRKCGCELGQGYLFSKPVDEASIPGLARLWMSDGAIVDDATVVPLKRAGPGAEE